MDQTRRVGTILGVVSVSCGAAGLIIQVVGGLIAGVCCAWVGWPAAIAAVACGILAIMRGAKLLGIIGIVLTALGVILTVVLPIVLASMGIAALKGLAESGAFR